MLKEIAENVLQNLKDFGAEKAIIVQYNVHDPDRLNQKLLTFNYKNERFYLAITKVEKKNI